MDGAVALQTNAEITRPTPKASRAPLPVSLLSRAKIKF